MQSFAELKISPSVLRAITELGFETPSPIQAEALPILLGEPTDFLGLAATGTGKTAAFAIPLLERLEPKKGGVQALILCPTRELAMQVSGQVDLMGKHKGIRSVAIYGGASYGDQIRGLRSGASIVVGTPGRVVDHMNKGTLMLDKMKVLVLDEADEMISMGFKDDLEVILGSAPVGECNTWLFSATMSPEVRKVADKYLNDPKQVQVNRKEMLSETVEQLYYFTREHDKPELVCKLIDAADDFYGLVFCQTKALVVDLTQYLNSRGYRVDCLHGDMDQNARERTMKAFRARAVTVLVCTDVASRGLDVKDITHVLNYSLPRELDSYVHRIGRTARSGKSGVAMSLVTASHKGILSRIERLTRSRILEGRIPSRREIAARKITKDLATFQDQPYYHRAVEIMGNEWRDAISALAPEEIAGRFLAMLHPDIFNDAAPAQAPAQGASAARAIVQVSPSQPAATGVVVLRKPEPSKNAVRVIAAAAAAPVTSLEAAPSESEEIKPSPALKKAFAAKKPDESKKPYSAKKPYVKKPYGAGSGAGSADSYAPRRFKPGERSVGGAVGPGTEKPHRFQWKAKKDFSAGGAVVGRKAGKSAKPRPAYGRA